MYVVCVVGIVMGCEMFFFLKFILLLLVKKLVLSGVWVVSWKKVFGILFIFL